jgi:uncharacterized membrane protein (DUF4010 family)
MFDFDVELGSRLAVALALGLLVGTQRERARGRIAGVRTFGVIGALGGFAGALHPWGGSLLLAAGALATTASMMMGQHLERASARHGAGDATDPGQTTEVAALLTYAIGAYAVLGELVLAVVGAGALTVLLHGKKWMHSAIRSLGERDFVAIVQVVLLALVVLPIVPDVKFGPDEVVSLRNVVWMVVLVSGIGLAGYFAHRRLGRGQGLLVAGLIGGLVSSTATTASASRNARSGAVDDRAAAVTVMLAGAVVWLRVLVEVAVASPSHLVTIGAPLAGAAIATGLIAAILWWRARDADAGAIEHKNPAQLGTAIGFGLIYAVVLLVVAWVRTNLSARWLYAAALLSGLTDMDAITLSTARMAEVGRLEPGEAWPLMAVAFLGNLVFKTLLAGAIGGTSLLRRLAVPMSLTAAVVVAIVLVGALL